MLNLSDLPRNYLESKMFVGYENIFPLVDAKEYVCAIQKYEMSHSGLYIKLYHHNVLPFLLYFVDVRYFACPTSWKSADFNVATKPDEHVRILKETGLLGAWPKDFLLNELTIYFISIGNAEIRIVARDVERLEIDRD
jgi:hypothetical protein